MTHAVETVAELLWNRFSPEHEVDWPSPNADEYRRVAADVLGAVLTRPSEQAVTEAMRRIRDYADKPHADRYVIRNMAEAALKAAMEAGRDV